MSIEPKAMAGDIPVYCSHDEIVDIMKVIPNPKNPNMHPDRQIEILSQVIKAQGWRKPITVSRRSGFVVAGHGRLQAALLMGADKVPVDYQHYANEAEEYADLVADNRIAELSSVDEDLLIEILNEINDTDIDTILTGYEYHEIDDLIGEHPNDSEVFSEPYEDDFEVEVPKEAKAKYGDIYQLGRHRLKCGDSTNKEDFEKLMDGNIADITFTSPPYNAGTTVTESTSNKTTKYNGNDDNKSDAEYISFLNSYLKNTLNHSHFSFMNIQSISNNKIALIDTLYQNKEIYADTIIWDKIHGAPAMAENVLNSTFEYVHVFSKKANRAIGTKKFRGTLPNIVHIPSQRNNEYSDIHNATFSVEFASHFIKEFSTDSVLDPFGGTGTTMIACEQLNKTCYMMEYEPLYVDVIIERWEKFTGKKAVLLTDRCAL